jgi:hypothetical protein
VQKDAADAGAVPCLLQLMEQMEQMEVEEGEVELSKARAVQHILLALGRCVQQNPSAQKEFASAVRRSCLHALTRSPCCRAQGGVDWLCRNLTRMEEDFLAAVADGNSGQTAVESESLHALQSTR